METTLSVYDSEWLKTNIATSGQSAHYLAGKISRMRLLDVLDIGCGCGRLVNELEGIGCRAMGIDIVDSNIGYAIKNFRGRFLLANPARLVEYGHRFSLVVMSHIVEHYSDPLKELITVKALLKPGAKLLIAVPNLLSCGNGWRESRLNVVFDKTHRRAFTWITLSDLLRDAGYEVETIETHTYKGSILNGWIMNLGRRLLTGKHLSLDSKPIIKTHGSLIESACSLIPSGIFDRISERGLRGCDLIVVAKAREM